MRVLLDSNLPSAFAALLPGHRTETTHARRWSDLDDGPLLDAAEREYDAFVTMDQSLRFQQNLRGVVSESSLCAHTAIRSRCWHQSHHSF
jgi:predicted nuclease of predicted toxin-antitoxin system